MNMKMHSTGRDQGQVPCASAATTIETCLGEIEQIEVDAYDALQMAHITEGLVERAFSPRKDGELHVRTTEFEWRQLLFATEQVRRQVEAIHVRLGHLVAQAELAARRVEP